LRRYQDRMSESRRGPERAEGPEQSAAAEGPAGPAGAYGDFLRLFNQGRFWDSHESLEVPWRETGSEFFHGLILLASAFVHVERGNRHGIAAQLAKAAPVLEACRPHYLGLAVDRILAHAAECRQIVAENHGAPAEAWSLLIPPLRLEYDPALVRGDEPELRGSGAERRGSGAERRAPNGRATNHE
jgi:hypothetical protein